MVKPCDRRRWRRTRTVHLETLEPRLLLASDCHNSLSPLDVNGDSHVSTDDAQLVVDHLNDRQSRLLSSCSQSRYVDVNADGFATPIDALLKSTF